MLEVSCRGVCKFVAVYQEVMISIVLETALLLSCMHVQFIVQFKSGQHLKQAFVEKCKLKNLI